MWVAGVEDFETRSGWRVRVTGDFSLAGAGVFFCPHRVSHPLPSLRAAPPERRESRRRETTLPLRLLFQETPPRRHSVETPRQVHELLRFPV
jgi:hypothetical protein